MHLLEKKSGGGLLNVPCVTFYLLMVNYKFSFIFAGLGSHGETGLPKWSQPAETMSGQACTKVWEARPGQSQRQNCKIR